MRDHVDESQPVEYFRRLFARLSGIEEPYRWQQALFEQLLSGECPSEVCLPTGLGKTSVMYVWLLALAWEALHRAEGPKLPRRLVWVVDRRVVVDQATEDAEILTRRIEDTPEVGEALRRLSVVGVEGSALAVSTLRGERADNRAWSVDPSRPAIIVGTVDMVGSRLLFSGYGDSRRRRPLHAGLLGQDTLIVNDEAHLTPAFAGLLTQLRQVGDGLRPLRVMLLSATPRDNTRRSFFPETLDADLNNHLFRMRYRAVKRLCLHEHDDTRKGIQSLAIEPDRRTIVFVRSPEDARKLAAAIESRHKGRVSRSSPGCSAAGSATSCSKTLLLSGSSRRIPRFQASSRAGWWQPRPAKSA